MQAYAVLGVLMSLVGGFCSVSCSMLMPSFFYAVLHWTEMSTARKLGCWALLSCGVLLVVLIVSSDVSVLIQRLESTAGTISDPADY